MNIEDLALKLQETSDKAERNEGRIEKLERDSGVLHKLVTAVEVMAEQLKNMNSKVTKVQDDMEEIKEKPGKRWDSLVSNIIWAVVGAVLAFILAKIGL